MSAQMNLLKKDQAARLDHIRAKLTIEGLDKGLIDRVVNRTGDPGACASRLSSYCLANAVFCWFSSSDLSATRQWFGEAGRMRRLSYELREKPSRTSTGGKMADLMPSLVANDETQIRWFADHDFMYAVEEGEDPSNIEFWAMQFIFALRENWSMVESRSRRVLDDPSIAPGLDRFLPDHRFFAALAASDEAGMNAALQEVLGEESQAWRQPVESGFTESLISTHAVIYTKLAWRRGHFINPGSFLVPSEWLPLDAPPIWVSPLADVK